MIEKCSQCGKKNGQDNNIYYSCEHLVKSLIEKFYGPNGELSDLSHLRGIRLAIDKSTEFEYKGDIKF